MEADLTLAPAESPPSQARHELLSPPGGLLMWIVVALELFAFAMVFGVIAHLRATQPAVFIEGQRALSPMHGVALTVVLVTSGWLAAEAVSAVRGGRLTAARRYYAGAVASGLAFVVIKVVDYAEKARAGLSLGRTDFWDAYFLGTGFHFVHVLLGLVLLSYVGLRVGRTKFEDEETTVAGTALFWHMCDVAWFFLFPLLYVRS